MDLNPHLKVRAVGDVIRHTSKSGSSALGADGEDSPSLVDHNVPFDNVVANLNLDTAPDANVLRWRAGVRWNGSRGDSAALLLASGKVHSVGCHWGNSNAGAILVVADILRVVGIALLLADQQGSAVAGGGGLARVGGGVARVGLGSWTGAGSCLAAAHSLADLK